MSKILIGIFLFFVVWPASASVSYEPLLNQVTVQFTADKWIRTSTPLITIGIDASVSDSNMGNVQSGFLVNLNKISAGVEWKITSSNRSEDPSGLEKVRAVAEARVPDSALAGLRDRVKKISRPGETYTVVNIAFTPTEAEQRAADADLRENIYQQVDAEKVLLNKMFPDQKYFLHQLRFSSSPDVQPLMAQPMMLNVREAKGGAASLPVSNHVLVNGFAVLASAPTSAVIEWVHGMPAKSP